jgi:hypothetical protein
LIGRRALSDVNSHQIRQNYDPLFASAQKLSSTVPAYIIRHH